MTNIQRKLTRIDEWYKRYAKRSAHRQHKSDKRLANRAYRKVKDEV